MSGLVSGGLIVDVHSSHLIIIIHPFMPYHYLSRLTHNPWVANRQIISCAVIEILKRLSPLNFIGYRRICRLQLLKLNRPLYPCHIINYRLVKFIVDARMNEQLQSPLFDSGNNLLTCHIDTSLLNIHRSY